MNISSTEEKEKVYVTHTCKHCKRAFIDVDTINVQDTPSNQKYCPECKQKGFGKTKRRKKNEQCDT